MDTLTTYPPCAYPGGCTLYSTNGSGYCSNHNLAAGRHAPNLLWNESEYRRKTVSQTRCICGATCSVYAMRGYVMLYGCTNGGRWERSTQP